MPHFDLEASIPAVRLNKKVLLELETYLVNNVSDKYDYNPAEVQKFVSVTVVEPVGSEEFASINNMRRDNFPKNTKSVNIKLDIPYLRREDNRIERLDIKFTSYRNEGAVWIRAKGDRSREKVIELYNGIVHILDDHGSWHRIFHPPSRISMLISMLSGSSGVASLAIFKEETLYWPLPLMLGLLTIVLLLYTWVAPWLWPYTLFEAQGAHRPSNVVR